jgi:hypothetical protein
VGACAPRRTHVQAQLTAFPRSRGAQSSNVLFVLRSTCGQLVLLELAQSYDSHLLPVDGCDACSLPHFWKRYPVDRAQEINAVWRLTELRHHIAHHQCIHVDDVVRRAEVGERSTNVLNVSSVSPIQKVNVARCTHDAVDAERIATDQNDIRALLVQANDEIEEVRRQASLPCADSMPCHRRGRLLREVPVRRRSAAAIAYAWLDTRATEASRRVFDRETGGSSPGACNDTRRLFHVLRRCAARAARSSAPEPAGRISAPAPLAVRATIDTPTIFSSVSADSRLTLGRCPRSSSATSRGLTPARLASSLLLQRNCVRAFLSNTPKLSDSIRLSVDATMLNSSRGARDQQPLYVPRCLCPHHASEGQLLVLVARAVQRTPTQLAATASPRARRTQPAARAPAPPSAATPDPRSPTTQ